MKLTVFGEILWDVFGEEKTIGGAPYNFAAHAARLGAEVALVSAVGRDSLGQEALRKAEQAGLSANWIAVLDKPTGYCRVTLQNGAPSYELVRDVAYDAIPLPPALPAGDALYFGTLAQREEASRRTLEKLLEGFSGEVFFDINIRQSFYTQELIRTSLTQATILKISREEISVLGIPGSPEEICRELASRFPRLHTVLVTLDKDGAFAFSCKDGGTVYCPVQKVQLVSAVGAGDSFSAGFLCNLLAGHPTAECLSRASRLAGYVVTCTGAVPDYPASLLQQIHP